MMVDVDRCTVYLPPGQMHVGREVAITTILGSCVAVCLWDGNIGGMNHFLLPRGPGGPRTELRYAVTAVPRLLHKMLEAGANLSRLQAKVFGGARVLSAPTQNHLGMQNADAALEILAASRIPVSAQDVGGVRGRKLVFDTDDGSVLVKYL
jgi:chemotaxis protein CheD